jgi:putative tryptophan/tyrosine transport system substrate-binding protein
VRRRDFFGFLVGTAVTRPLSAHAQRAQRLPTIGFLGAASASTWTPWTAAFVARLGEFGWIDGRTVAIEYRWAEGRNDRYAEFATEFARLSVDVIVTSAPAVPAAKQATSFIPIVFAIAGDPLGTGLVTSLARPGGNVTGLSFQNTETASKRIELLREIVPGLHRLAVVGNVGYAAALTEMREVAAAAGAFGLEVIPLEIRQAEDILPGIGTLNGRAGALYVVTDPLLNANRAAINASTQAAQLPTMAGFREFVDAGGLVSYGANFPDLFRRAAEIVDKILRGAKPGDIPVEQPTKFDLVVNLGTARAIGLKIPETILIRADQVIE